MIYSGLDDIEKAKAMAGKVIQEVRHFPDLFFQTFSFDGKSDSFSRKAEFLLLHVGKRSPVFIYPTWPFLCLCGNGSIQGHLFLV